MNRLSVMLAVMLGLILLAGPALAQTAHQDPPAQDYAASTQVQALIALARTQNQAAPQPLISQTLISMGTYRVNLEYRSAKAPATINDTDKILFTVLDGAANITTGGTVPDAKRVTSSTQSGSSIVGGKSRYIIKGDIVMVPENMPYMFVPANNTILILTSVRVPVR